MRTRVLVIIGALMFFVCLVFSCHAPAATVVFNFQSGNAAPQAVRTVNLYPTGTFTNGSGAIITRDRFSGTTDTNGSVTFSNVYGWTYRGEIIGTTITTTNWYNFPVTNGLILAADSLGTPTNQVLTYSQAQIDGSFAHRAGDSFTGGVTNNSTAGFVGNGGGLTNIGVTNIAAVDVTGTVVVPSGGTTNTGVPFKRFIASPSSSAENYPVVFQLLTNQNFVIQDELGNNIFGIRHDTYGAGSGKKWLLAFGSKQQGMIDQIFDLATGADFTWRINGDLKNTFQFQTYSQGIGFRFIYNNTNYYADEVDCPLLDNYGTVRPTSIVGLPVHLTQTATVGAGAGSGGSVGVTADNNATDIGAVITLTTGHTATAAGTIFTYSPANDVGQFDAGVVALKYRPTLTATNANALGVMSAIYAVGGTSAIVVKSTVPLPIDTAYAFSLFLHR